MKDLLGFIYLAFVLPGLFIGMLYMSGQSDAKFYSQCKENNGTVIDDHLFGDRKCIKVEVIK